MIQTIYKFCPYPVKGGPPRTFSGERVSAQGWRAAGASARASTAGPAPPAGPPPRRAGSPRRFPPSAPGVGVRASRVNPRGRPPEPVAMARDRREVGDEEDEILPVPGPPREGHHALLPVAAVDPLEAGGIEVHLVECRFAPVEPVH